MPTEPASTTACAAPGAGACGTGLRPGGDLTAADAVAAARELGIAVPVEAGTAPGALPGMPDLPAVARMQDVPELARLWEIVLGVPVREASGMIRETATAELPPARAAKAWRSWTRRHGGPAARLLAIGTVNRLGPAAEPAWRDALGRPELRPYAKIALTEIAGGEPGVTVLPGLEPELADLAWLLTDVLATVSADDPDELPRQIRDSVPPGQEQQMFDAMSRSPHPDAASVLSLIGQHHPDRQVAKAARRSAHRAASRPKPAR